MKVTPVKRKFGRYQPGEEFDLPDKVARIFINARKLEAVGGYQTRALQAASAQVPVSVEALLDSAGMPWDGTLHTSTKLKNSDGTWRKKPGRAAG
jgi:hypothetical protein